MNIGRHLAIAAGDRPRAAALKVPLGRSSGSIDYLTLSFAELDLEVDAWCARLAARGVRPGDRTLIMVRPGLPLIASVFALFRIGAIPVVIDPGMRLGAFLSCVQRTRPRALVGIPLAQGISRLFRGTFRSVESRVPVSGSLHARLAVASERDRYPKVAAPPVSPSELAAILFTSGSTGSPKGVRYDHGMFDAQVTLVRETYGIEPGEVDLPLLPIFALFNPALGMTTVVPEIDPRRPAAADPARIVQAILQENVTNSFGSPTLWRLISDHCRERNIALPSLRRVLCAGAPVPARLWTAARAFLPNGRMHSPYGATEALPVSTICDDRVAAASLLATAMPVFESDDIPSQGAVGAPVGRPLPGVAVKIIAIAEGPIATTAATRELAPGEIGEIIVKGAVVSREYDALPEANRRAKIAEPPLAVWHRMGDCGYIDADGLLWFCGRVVERVTTPAGTLYTEPCERIFRLHPRAWRCALIGLGEPGRQVPALAVEAKPKSRVEAAAFAAELGRLAAAHAHTASITRFYFFAKFPLDVRHNAKIHRRTLAARAAGTAGYDSGSVSS